ncbi:MAG: hypothetical protein NC548_15965 [Lachnospiraceae bacterium]|nr:hypothetical protein [Lachnospiraceae bacterium]
MKALNKEAVQFARETVERAHDVVNKIERINEYLGDVSEEISLFAESAEGLESMCFNNSTSEDDVEERKRIVAREFAKLNFCFKYIDKLYSDLF